MKIKLLLLALAILITGCTTSQHGNFISTSYTENSQSTILGKVTGESKQTWLLYLFPVGQSPSTEEAINSAKSKMEDTAFLTDISIDDRVYIGFGYSERVIEVKATAIK